MGSTRAGRVRAPGDDLTQVSRFLAYVLRHRPEALDLTLDRAGWVDIDDLLAGMAAAGRPIDREILRRLAHDAPKIRFEIADGRIRAAQGHSIDVDLRLEPRTPPTLLYHGTVGRHLRSIRAEGLRPGRRHHVHLSIDEETARAVGARRGQPVVLTVDAGRMHEQDFVFYRAANGVWLTDRVPPDYLKHQGRAVPDGSG